MSAPQGSGGGSQQTYYPNPAYYLGQMTSDPSSPSVGQWWYRTDTGQIKMNTQNGIVTLQYQTTEIISSNTTIGGTNVIVTSRLVVLPGVTLTIYGSIVFTQDVVVFGTLLSNNPSASSSAPSTNSYNLRGNLSIDGTYSIAQYNTDQIIYLGGLSFIQTPGSFSVSGTLALNISLTISASFTFSGNGTLTISSGYTLTIGSNISVGGITIGGAGTLAINSGYTLTQTSSIGVAVPTVNVSGTWANAGYGITIPSGATVTWNVSGSFTTASTPGTLTVNGTCYWYGAGIIGANATPSQALVSFVLSFAGSGIFVGAPEGQGAATNAITLSSAAIPANSGSGSGTSSNKNMYYSLTALAGSAVGQYTIGAKDTTKNWWAYFVLIYIGTANTNYSVSGYFGGNSLAFLSGDGTEAFNMTGSAGTITITGTLYT